MFIKPTRRKQSGWTLVEIAVAVGVFSISGLALATIFLFCIRSFAAMTNYAVLNRANRYAMDTVVREIRQSINVVNYSSNATSRALTLLNGDGLTVTYAFDSGTKQFTRNDGTTTTTLLTNCNLLNFQLYVRPPESNSFDNYPIVTSSTNWQSDVKVVELSWKTSMAICPTALVNSEEVQTAKVIIRKQRGT
jgi:type II secretory pathway pseudopilin PulG